MLILIYFWLEDIALIGERKAKEVTNNFGKTINQTNYEF